MNLYPEESQSAKRLTGFTAFARRTKGGMTVGAEGNAAPHERRALATGDGSQPSRLSAAVASGLESAGPDFERRRADAWPNSPFCSSQARVPQWHNKLSDASKVHQIQQRLPNLESYLHASHVRHDARPHADQDANDLPHACTIQDLQ